MKRAAIYARFSSDLQSDRSIEDQFELCRLKAKREGFKIVAEFEDRAKSGSSIIGRDGIAQMLEAARAGEFDILLVEALDRISRDQEDLAFCFKRLSFKNIDIVSVHDGRADQIQIGVRGIVSALYLTDLANKTRRGQAGNVREGKHAGGLAYGYRATPGKPGEWVIHEPEAEVIRRIYREYAAGDRSKTIILRLNAEGIRPPRGSYWAPNTLTGSHNRKNGILGNEIYCGRLVWNRLRMIKDPDTGKRVSRLNPESEWHRANVPHLKIVEPELFEQVAAIRAERAPAPAAYRRKPKHLFSGLLRCGTCGGGMSVRGKDRGGIRVTCTQHKNAGTCANGRSYYLHHIERTMLEGLRDQLRNPAGIERFLKTYNEERMKLAREGIRSRSTLERQLAAARRAFDNIVEEASKSEFGFAPFRPKMRAAHEAVERLEKELAQIEPASNVVALHPAATARYLAIIESITKAPAGQDTEAIRELIESASVRLTAANEPLTIDVKGKLASLIGAAVFPEGTLSGVKVVAREGFEPPTPGL